MGGIVMRKPFVAANWKMNKTAAEARELVSAMLPGLQSVTTVERIICPPATTVPAVSEILSGTGIGVGTQNMHWEENGAYTGELSPEMVKEFCEYVILGHSERRAYFAETDETVNKKLKAALAHDLIPIVCVGETLEENEAGKTDEVVIREIKEGLKDISKTDAVKIVIAYEPIWAIGTGKAATGDLANDVIARTIRVPLKEMFGEDVAGQIRVLYGGSVKSSNAAEFFNQPEIDGALVGGASLKADDFPKIIKAAEL